MNLVWMIRIWIFLRSVHFRCFSHWASERFRDKQSFFEPNSQRRKKSFNSIFMYFRIIIRVLFFSHLFSQFENPPQIHTRFPRLLPYALRIFCLHFSSLILLQKNIKITTTTILRSRRSYVTRASSQFNGVAQNE